MASTSSKGTGPPGTGSGAPRDRRATHRAAIEIPAILHVGTREVACTVRDLSRQGIALVVKGSVAPGMVVRVGFRLPNSRQPVEVSGVLVRTDGGRHHSTIGLQFIEPNADAVRVIDTFVDRNRSDRPFSRRPARGRRLAGVDTSESGAALDGLYKKAVSDIDEKGGRRRGLFARWLHRAKS
jgi:hypothetical protein